MNIETLISGWDGEEVIVRMDRPSGAWLFIAIHSTRLGPAAGGTRMKSYRTPADALQDAMRLSEGMTFKWAVPGLARGGAKAVIATPADLDPSLRPDVLRRYGALVRQLGGLFSTGPDVGTNDSDMDIIAETGAPYIFGRTPAAGGSGTTGPITAVGVFAGIKVVCESLFGDSSVSGKRVLVQGAGSVGGTLIGLLRDGGAEVLFNDVSEAAIRHFRDELGLTFVPAETLYKTACDIFSPCALGAVLSETTIPLLHCRAVAGAANNQLAAQEDAERLRARGILYAPDYVINSGGAIGVTARETDGLSQEQAEQQVSERVQGALRRIFEMASAEGITTDAAARRIAEEHLQAARQPYRGRKMR